MKQPPRTINWKKNLFFLWLSQFLATAGFGCCMPFIPLLLKDTLHVADDQMRGFYVALYYLSGMVSLCIASTVWGVLADRFGRKIMLLRAGYAAAICYPLLAFAPNVGVLILIRFICSFFSGTVNPAQTLLVTNTPEEKHGFALGTLSTSVWSGNMTGFLAGGLIVHYFGYTAAFITCGAIYLTSALLVQIFVEEDFHRSAPAAAPEKKKKRRSLRDIASPAVCWLLLMFLLMGLARRIDNPFIAMLVEQVHGEEKAAFFTGVLGAAAALGGIFSGILIGRLCDKYDPGKLVFPILLVSGTVSILQAFSVNIGMLIAARFLAYFAGGGLQPVLQVILAKVIPRDQRGAYFGWTTSMNQAGGILCSFISGGIALFGSIRGIFASAGLIMLLMVPLMIPAGRACKREEKELEPAS